MQSRLTCCHRAVLTGGAPRYPTAKLLLQQESAQPFAQRLSGLPYDVREAHPLQVAVTRQVAEYDLVQRPFSYSLSR